MYIIIDGQLIYFLVNIDANFWRYAVGFTRWEEGTHNFDDLLRRRRLWRGSTSPRESDHVPLLGLVPPGCEGDILRCGRSLLLLRCIAPNVS